MNIPIHTFLHGSNSLEQRDTVMKNINDDTYQYRVALPEDRAIITFKHKGLDRIKDHSHILLFEGFTFTGCMTDKITSIPITVWKDDWSTTLNPVRRMPTIKANVFQSRAADLSFFNPEDHAFRQEEVGLVLQEIPLHLVIIPKSDVRFIFLTYKKRSLEPVYKTVRVLNGELCIENATK